MMAEVESNTADITISPAEGQDRFNKLFEVFATKVIAMPVDLQTKAM